MSAVELTGVAKTYEGTSKPALAPLDLAIASGAFVVLVGPSGCGKSTTLRIVAGLEEPTAGQVRIADRDVTNLPPAKRDIAMVFQSYALYPHMTVFDNMAFALRLRKLPAAEVDQRVKAAAESLGLTEYLARLPRALSGGQRQRVAIGRAVVRAPKVFLFDEPLSNLDAKLRGEMRREIARIHRGAGATSLYVTHDQVEAMTLADQIVVLRNGDLQQVGSPREIYDQPANRFVAEFFGTPTMNFLAAEARGGAVHGKGFVLPPGRSLPPGAVVVGIRPERITVASGPAGDDAIAGEVVMRELLGAEVVLAVATAAGELTVRTDVARAPARGEQVTLRIDVAGAHFFDGKSEVRL